MINNDVLRSLRYMLDFSESAIVDIIALADDGAGKSHVNKGAIVAYLKKEEEAGFQPCPDETMARFLNGLVIHRRGREEGRPAPALDLPLTNNIVLKKLRVAFNLKEDDMFAIFGLAGLRVTKPELSSFFRKEGQRNYRGCGDQILRNFLKGLTLRLRG